MQADVDKLLIETCNARHRHPKIGKAESAGADLLTWR